jgi:hypothetical protein
MSVLSILGMWFSVLRKLAAYFVDLSVLFWCFFSFVVLGFEL